MIEEKEDLLIQYYGLSKTMHERILQGMDDDFITLLAEREELIIQIDQLDKAAGTRLMNDRIQHLLQNQLEVEKDIQKQLQFSLSKRANQVRFAQNETFLSKQYEGNTPVSKGVFYDRKK